MLKERFGCITSPITDAFVLMQDFLDSVFGLPLDSVLGHSDICHLSDLFFTLFGKMIVGLTGVGSESAALTPIEIIIDILEAHSLNMITDTILHPWLNVHASIDDLDSLFFLPSHNLIGADGGTRTLTTLRPPDFESGAYADSATSALFIRFLYFVAPFILLGI